jgi:uncharacterized iron-regulated membrane protein
MAPIKKLSSAVRSFRSIHQYIGLVLMGFMLLMSITGVILGWKKHVPALLPETSRGISANLGEWMPLDQLNQVATETLQQQVAPDISLVLDRIDARPDKGVVKFVYRDHYWEVQLDAANGEVKSVARRNSDLIEQIHDGSIVGQVFKVAYTNLVGWGLLALTLTGFGLWYGPKVIRRQKAQAPAKKPEKSVSGYS